MARICPGCEFKNDDLHNDDCDTVQYNDYRVWIRSKPGMYAQYDGKVDVLAKSEENAKQKALDKLRKGAFKDRSDSMWVIEKVEVLCESKLGRN